jgi:hypothetical protein
MTTLLVIALAFLMFLGTPLLGIAFRYLILLGLAVLFMDHPELLGYALAAFVLLSLLTGWRESPSDH